MTNVLALTGSPRPTVAGTFSKLELLPAPDDHRRVLTVLAHVRG